MPWNTKSPEGGPEWFTNDDAMAAVDAADFTHAVYVNTSAKSQATRQAVAFVDVGEPDDAWTICVVGHVHVTPDGVYTGPGNSYIPGWDSWEMTTPALQAAAIAESTDHGTFPEGTTRYPRRR